MLKKPRILGIFSGMVPSAVIYVIKPLNALAQEGRIDFEYVTEPNLSLKQIHRSDLVVFSRNYLPEYGYVLDEALSAYIPTVYDIDDNFWELSGDTFVGRLHHYRPRMDQLETYLRRVNLVRTFNRRLYKIVKDRFNRNVILATPGIDFNLASGKQNTKENGKVTISYVTSRGTEDELMDLFSVDLKRILETFPDKVEAVFWGTVPDEYSKYPNVHSKPIIYDYDGYIKDLANGDIQIGLAPLIPSEFYLSKTNTKFRDYSVCRIAGIYSDVETYSSCVVHGETGLLVKQEPGAWFNAIQQLILDVSLRKRICDQAYEYVFKHHRQEIMEQEWWEIIRNMILSPVDGGIKDIAERARVYTGGVQKTKLKTRLYLGQTAKPIDGFLHVYQSNPLPGGIIADLKSLPFEPDSVDLLVSDHALDASEDLPRTLQEIHRVCADRALVSMISTYGHQAINLAHPKASHPIFNEHTPRYWTTSPECGVNPEEYVSPGQTAWGLSSIDTRLLNLICLRLDFFYYPFYRYLSAKDKRESRKKYLDVCDEIVYQLLVCKTPLSEEEMKDSVDQLKFYEPEHVVNRRFQETIDQLRVEVDAAKDQINLLSEERNKFEQLFLDSKRELERKRTMLDETRAHILIQEISGMRANIAFKFFRRLRDRTDAASTVSENFIKLLDDSRLFCGNLAGYRLQVSDEINRVPFISYVLYPRGGRMKEISFAFVVDWIPDQGEMGVEFVTQQGQIIQQVKNPAREIRVDIPSVFRIEPVIETTQAPILVRLFARDVNLPVRLFEWRKYRLGGFGKIDQKPFCGLGFVNRQ